MDEKSTTPAKPLGARRGRKPRRVVPQEPDAKPAFFSELDVSEEECEGDIVLRVAGTLGLEPIVTLRDSAFTAIGARPGELCLDLRLVTVPLDLPAMEALVTIGRVARMMQVRFSVIVPPSLALTWGTAGLSCLIPLQADPRFFQPGVKAKFAGGVSADGVSK